MSFLRGEHQGGWLTPILLEIRAVMRFRFASLLEVTSLLSNRWEWGDQWPHEQCGTVTYLDDPCRVVGIGCSRGKITASQGLAGAPSYVPVSTPVRSSVCFAGGGWVMIDSLSILPPGP